MRNDERMMKP